MLLSVEGLAKRYGPVHALGGVTFDVREGEVVGLIGPNGAGKSTLLACLAGLASPDAGRVHLGGRMLPAAERRRSCFFLPDGIAPWVDQPADWVLDFGAELYGSDEPWRDRLAGALDLRAFLARPMGELSKGQRKRVLLALALLVPRAMTLIDEPFDGLDPRQSIALGAQIRERAAAGRAFVLSIHAMGEATRTCDRHVLLHEGRVLAEGTLAALRARSSLGESAGLEEVFLALT
jgi:ABC-2 type transport system ATP-binding protein